MVQMLRMNEARALVISGLIEDWIAEIRERLTPFPDDASIEDPFARNEKAADYVTLLIKRDLFDHGVLELDREPAPSAPVVAFEDGSVRPLSEVIDTYRRQWEADSTRVPVTVRPAEMRVSDIVSPGSSAPDVVAPEHSPAAATADELMLKAMLEPNVEGLTLTEMVKRVIDGTGWDCDEALAYVKYRYPEVLEADASIQDAGAAPAADSPATPVTALDEAEIRVEQVAVMGEEMKAEPPLSESTPEAAESISESAESAPDSGVAFPGAAPGERLVDVVEAMELFGVSRTTLFTYAREGKLRTYSRGNRVFYIVTAEMGPVVMDASVSGHTHDTGLCGCPGCVDQRHQEARAISSAFVSPPAWPGVQKNSPIEPEAIETAPPHSDMDDPKRDPMQPMLELVADDAPAAPEPVVAEEPIGADVVAAPAEQWVTVGRAAAFFGVTTQTVENWAWRGVIGKRTGDKFARYCILPEHGPARKINGNPRAHEHNLCPCPHCIDLRKRVDVSGDKARTDGRPPHDVQTCGCSACQRHREKERVDLTTLEPAVVEAKVEDVSVVEEAPVVALLKRGRPRKVEGAPTAGKPRTPRLQQVGNATSRPAANRRTGYEAQMGADTRIDLIIPPAGIVALDRATGTVKSAIAWLLDNEDASNRQAIATVGLYLDQEPRRAQIFVADVREQIAKLPGRAAATGGTR